MPAKLSKFSVPATCRDYVHPWTSSCVSATAGLGLHALQESFRIYSTVYFVTLLLKGKVPSGSQLKKTLLGILQSTAFLSWSAFAYSMFLCSFRRVSGNFNIISVSFLPSFLSSLTAILVERPSRRTLLCLYVSNIATETLFRMGVWRGYFPVIPHGEVYIFALSMAMLLYYYRTEKSQEDSIFKILRFVVGPHESCNNPASIRQSDASDSKRSMLAGSNVDKKMTKSTNEVSKALRLALDTYKKILDNLKAMYKHSTCPHPFSCMHYVLSGIGKLFGLGIGVQLGLKLVFQAKKIARNPKLLKTLVFQKQNIYLAMFLGGFSGAFRAMSCLSRKTFGKDSELYAIPAGLVASIAFAMFPDNTIALYVMWKALQIVWNSGVDAGKLPEVKWFVIALYCFSTAVLFHAAIIEPHNLRTSYWKFLHNLSGGRIAAMDRQPLNGFGLQSWEYLQEVLRKTRTTDKIAYSF